jgi:two-component system cell cycle sensor histidine kinase/response regulator CckA
MSASGSFPAPSVLIVEDSFLLAAAMAERLERAGYEAEAVGSGEEAERRLALGAPDLILLDVDLGPGLDGVELARRLAPALRRRIVFVTGLAAERCSEIDALGCCGLLDKPLREDDLLTAVADALWRLEARSGGALVH